MMSRGGSARCAIVADVKGFMDLGEKIDPEEWYRIRDRFFVILPTALTREFPGSGNCFALRGERLALGGHRRPEAVELRLLGLAMTR
jgi:hypothetical protein